MASGAALLAGSALTQVLGGIVGAKNARAEGKAEAALYEQQGAVAEAQAKNAAAQEHDKYKRVAASQRANFGASGVDVNSGSPLDVLADTDAEGEVSAMQLLYSGKLERWNARQRAAQAKAQAKNRATNALLGGLTGGLSTGVSATGAFKKLED